MADNAAMLILDSVAQFEVVPSLKIHRTRKENNPARETGTSNVAVIRLEQFYPFPGQAIGKIFDSYPNAKQCIWVQEEPQNMGGWHFVADRLREVVPGTVKVGYVGRSASASPATGSYAIHELEQKKLVDEALNVTADEVSPASEPEVSEKVAPASS